MKNSLGIYLDILSALEFGMCNVLGSKSQLAFTERRTTDIYIDIIILYENCTVRLTSVGLVQARPNYW